MADYNVAKLGKLDDLKKKIFLKEMIGSSSVEMEVQKLNAGDTAEGFHSHKENEEIYFIIEGKGQLQVNDEHFPIEEGNVICVTPKGERSIKADTQMIVLTVQAKAGSLENGADLDGVICERVANWSN